MKPLATLALVLCAAGCASQAPGSQLTSEESDRFVDASMAFIDGVVEACVDTLEAGQSIAAMHGATGVYLREDDVAARAAAGTDPDTIVWRPSRSRIVTIMETPGESCTVGVMGLPPGPILGMAGEVLVQARKFTAGPAPGGSGAALSTQRYTKTVGGRDLTVLLVGMPGGVSNLMATVGWKTE